MKSLVRPVLVALSVGVIAVSLSHTADAARGYPTQKTIAVDTSNIFDIRVSHDSFAPLVRLPGQSTGNNANAQAGIAGQASGLGSETILLCNTIEPPNPVAEFLVGNNRIYAIVNTPIGTLTVKEIRLGSVVFSDGSVIAQTSCTMALQHPDLTLQSGTGTTTGYQGIVPGPGSSFVIPGVSGASGANVVASPGAVITTAPIVTPNPVINPYSTPASSAESVIPIIIRSPTP